VGIAATGIVVMSSSTQIADSAPSRLLSPGLLLLVFVLTGWSVFSLRPFVGRRLGVTDGGPWFVDSYATLAASDAVRVGLDPFKPNPLDVYHRPHSYSHWWFYLGDLGLTRRDNFALGGSWVLLFLLTALLLLRIAHWGEAAMAALVLLSPPVLLAVNRANNDLVVFFLLATGLVFLRAASPWRLAVYSTLVLLATGLKFYPIIGAAALLLVRPPKTMLLVALGTLVAGMILLAWLWTDFRRAVILAPIEVYTFGAPILFRDLGWTGPAPLLAGVLVLTLAAAVCTWRGWSLGLEDGDLRARLAYACGALLLVGCFLAGISFSYRLIFVIFLVPWLWRKISTSAARWTVLLLLAALWLDGFYCLGANIFVGPMPEVRLKHQQLIWRFFTQPIIWAAMALLAGSLLGMLRSALGSLRNSVRP